MAIDLQLPFTTATKEGRWEDFFREKLWSHFHVASLENKNHMDYFTKCWTCVTLSPIFNTTSRYDSAKNTMFIYSRTLWVEANLQAWKKANTSIWINQTASHSRLQVDSKYGTNHPAMNSVTRYYQSLQGYSQQFHFTNKTLWNMGSTLNIRI